MQSSPLRLFLLDDHAVVRLGYVHAISKDPGLQLVGAFSTAKSLLEALWRGEDADVLLLDYALAPDEIDGINLIAMLRAKRPAMKILVASAHDSPAIVALVLRAGASGFVGKDSLEELLPAIRAVGEGGAYVAPRYARERALIASESSPAYLPELGMESVVAGLSPREQEVLRCLMEGLTITGIASKFARSVKTVSNQKQSAFKKLGVGTIAELMSMRDKVQGK